MTSSANSSCGSPPIRQRGRPRKGTNPPSEIARRNTVVRIGERKKITKKVFDPSDNNLPNKRKRGRPIGSLNKSTIKKRMDIDNYNRAMTGSVVSESQSQASEEILSDDDNQDPDDGSSVSETAAGVCFVCLVQKTKSSSDKMVECRDCSNKAHMNCLQNGSGILKLRPDNTWQCPHCKTCVVCCETSDAGILTVCSICSDAYHALCHTPRIPERSKAWDQWECNNCLESRPIAITRSPSIALPQSVNDSPTSPNHEPFLLPYELDYAKSRLPEELPIDHSIPEIINWSIDDVYNYFNEHLPEAANTLKDQDFDGRALSVVRRHEIVRGLGLNLGPALKLYRMIVKLQTRKDDFTLCWA